MAPTNDIVKDEGDEHGEYVIKGGRRRQVARGAEGDWEVDVLEEIYSELLVQYPLEKWRKNAGKAEEGETIVELAVRK